MRWLATVTILLALLGTPWHMVASSKSQMDVKKDAAALTNIQKAIDAMGGDLGLAQIKDSIIVGSMNAAKGSKVKPSTFTWKTLGTEFRYETTRASSTNIFVSGYGKPALSTNGTVSAVFAHEALCSPVFQLPALVLSIRATDPNFSVIDKGRVVLLGKDAAVAQNSSALTSDLAAITQQTWYFDAATGLPLRVEYRIPEAANILAWTNAALDFTDFKQIDILWVPFTLSYSEEGVPVQVFSFTSANFNVGLDPAEFNLLGDGK